MFSHTCILDKELGFEDSFFRLLRLECRFWFTRDQQSHDRVSISAVRWCLYSHRSMLQCANSLVTVTRQVQQSPTRDGHVHCSSNTRHVASVINILDHYMSTLVKVKNESEHIQRQFGIFSIILQVPLDDVFDNLKDLLLERQLSSFSDQAHLVI